MTEFKLKTPEMIELGVASTYKAIENGVVSTYKKIESGVVGAYKRWKTNSWKRSSMKYLMMWVGRKHRINAQWRG